MLSCGLQKYLTRFEKDSDILPPWAFGEEPPMVMIVTRMQEPSVRVLFILCGHVSGCHTLECGESLCKSMLVSQTLSLCCGMEPRLRKSLKNGTNVKFRALFSPRRYLSTLQ